MELIVNFTPTGMIPTKAMTPHVPIDPDEIAGDVQQACEIGITMVHLHSRESGSVRVGLEDNIWYDPNRSRLARNADLVRRVHALAEANERAVMAPSTLRNLLDLEPGSGRYGRVN